MIPPRSEVARARPPGSPWRTALIAQARALHWISLGGAAVFLFWVNRNQWFNVDEWAWIVRRGVVGSPEHGLLEPHNEHWSTLPIVIWRAVFSVFGVRTYTPYLVLMITAHLVTVHLLWRLLLRVGVQAIVATIVCVPFAVLGAGWENLTSAFQFSFLMPVALGIGALLVIPDAGPLVRRDGIAIALLAVALLCSGVAVTMMIVVGVFALLVRGPAVAAAIVAPLGVVYVAWYAGWGNDPAGVPADPFTEAVQKLPEFVWEGLTEAVDGVTGLAGVGAVVLVLLGLFAVLRARPADPAWARIIAAASGAIVFLSFTALRRTSFGIHTAGAARYVYVVTALLLPLAAITADRLIRGRPLRLELLVLLTVFIMIVQVSGLHDEAERAAGIEQEQKIRILAAAEVAEEGADFLTEFPAPMFSPDVTTPDLVRLAQDGKLPDVDITPTDRLTALAYLQVTLQPRPRFRDDGPVPVVESVARGSAAPAAEPGCVDVTPDFAPPRAVLRFVEPASIEYSATGGATLGITLLDGTERGRTRYIDLSGAPVYLNFNLENAAAELTLSHDQTTTLCGVAPQG